MAHEERQAERIFRLVEELSGVKVCYWPLGLPRSGGMGFSMENPNHSSHTCAYCMKVKEVCGTGWCVRSKAFGIGKAAGQEEPFEGLCYMGVHDLVIPVRLSGQLIGILYLTAFRREGEEEKAGRLIRRGCRRAGVSPESLLRAYEELPCLSDERVRELTEGAYQLREILLELLRSASGVHRKPATREETKKRWITENVVPYIDNNYRSELSLKQLSEIFYVNSQYLCRAFRAQTGKSFKEYVAALRVKEAKALLQEKDRPVAEVARAVGFPDANYFSRVFRELTGRTPSQYRKETKNSPAQ